MCILNLKYRIEQHIAIPGFNGLLSIAAQRKKKKMNKLYDESLHHMWVWPDEKKKEKSIILSLPCKDLKNNNNWILFFSFCFVLFNSSDSAEENKAVIETLCTRLFIDSNYEESESGFSALLLQEENWGENEESLLFFILIFCFFCFDLNHCN